MQFGVSDFHLILKQEVLFKLDLILQDPSNKYSITHLGSASHTYHNWSKQITILRIINLLLKPSNNNPLTIEQAIESFKRYDYDKIIELFASITCSIPLSKSEFDRYHHNKKASLHHSKYWFFDYDEYGY